MDKSKLKINLSREGNQRGIWQYSSYLSPLADEFKLSLGEGNTQEIVLEKGLLLKREDDNPTGSLKDRGMAFLVSWANSLEKKDLVISSSGNAAIAASRYCSLAKINLFVFVSPKINQNKLKAIKEGGGKVYVSHQAISEAIKFAKKNGFLNLRPSQNEFGPEGYQTIAFELMANQSSLKDIFVPVSSGVALLGIARGFQKLDFLPRIHVCQSSAVCPIASFFVQDYRPEKNSLADSLVARYTPLRNEVISAVKKSGGSGWIISNNEIEEAQKKLRKAGVETSAEGALALAAWQKAKKSGWKLEEAVCLLTGKKVLSI